MVDGPGQPRQQEQQQLDPIMGGGGQDKGEERCNSPWQTLVLMRTDPIPIREIYMQGMEANSGSLRASRFVDLT